MSLIVKIMSAASEPDDRPNKGFKIITEVKSVDFSYNTEEHPGVPVITMFFDQGDFETFPLEGGNVYVMTETGKTIDTFTPAVGPFVFVDGHRIKLTDDGEWKVSDLMSELGIGADEIWRLTRYSGLEGPFIRSDNVHVSFGDSFATRLMTESQESNARTGRG